MTNGARIDLTDPNATHVDPEHGVQPGIEPRMNDHQYAFTFLTGPLTGVVMEVDSVSGATVTFKTPWPLDPVTQLEKRPNVGDEYFFAVTEHSNDVAMLLIDKGDQLHVNEDARALLKKLWRDAYRDNLEVLIPQMVEELYAGYLFTAGVKVSAGGKKRDTPRR